MMSQKMRAFACAGVLGAGAMSAVAVGDVVTITPAADNTLFESPTGALSNGSGVAMFAGRNSSATNSIRRAVVRFDIASAVPAGATIVSVELRLTEAGNNATPHSVHLHRLSESWGEGPSISGGAGGGGGGAPAGPGDATWLHRFFNTDAWTTPGGTFAMAASASTVVAGAGDYTWASTTDLVADVQSFLDSPAGNFGWILIGNEGAASSAKRFATREAENVETRPVLTITYIPTPGTAGMAIGLALILGTRRRRAEHRSA